MMTQEDVKEEERTPAAGGRPEEEEEEEEEAESKEKKDQEEERNIEAKVLKEVTSFATGRSRYRGGVSRRGPGHASGALPPRVIVTSSDRRGELLDDTHALDRNLPPPRLLETPHPQQSGYRVNYPGAKLRVGAPRPSHLTNTQGEGPAATIRRKEPYSINFGSSSLSTGAYHPPRVAAAAAPPDDQGHTIPRAPVKFYSTGGVLSPRRPLVTPPPHRPKGPRPQQQQQQQEPPPPPPPPPFRPSKLLPPTTLRSTFTTSSTSSSAATTSTPPPPTLRTFTRGDVRQVTPPVRDVTPPQGSGPAPPRGPGPAPPRGPGPAPPRGSGHAPPRGSGSAPPRGSGPAPPRGPGPAPPRGSGPAPPRGPGRAPSRGSGPAPPRGPGPAPPRRGQVVNAPRPAVTGPVSAIDSTSSLTPLGTISKSGVRAEIGHRSGAAEGHQSSSRPVQRRPSANIQDRHPVAGYVNPGDNSYQFVSGEVYTPPPLIRRTKHRSSQNPFVRVTTRRPVDENRHPVTPVKESHSTYLPKYAKDTIAEMEFEPKTFEAPHPYMYHNPNWFLMPVQGWFVLSIILAALLIVLTVVCAIIYNSLRKQRKKMRKLLTTGLVLPPCVDPVKHEMCQCRSLAPLVRSHTLLSRASVMSRTSHRSLRPPSRHQGVSGYDSSSQHMTTDFQSLPSPALQDQERDNNLDSITTANTQLEVDVSPPPLAPKKNSTTGSTAGGGSTGQDGGKSGGRESRLGNPEGRSSRENTRMAAHEARSAGFDGRSGAYDGRYSSKYEGQDGGCDGRGGGYGASHSVGGGGGGGSSSSSHHQRKGSSHNPDVQLTTIYPPPRRFEL